MEGKGPRHRVLEGTADVLDRIQEMFRKLECDYTEVAAKLLLTLFTISRGLISGQSLTFTKDMIQSAYSEMWGGELKDSHWSAIKSFLKKKEVIEEDATTREKYTFHPVIGWRNLLRKYEEKQKEDIEFIQRYLKKLGTIYIPFLTLLDGPGCPGPDTIQDRHKKTAELIRDNFTSSLVIYTGSFKWFTDIKDAIREKVEEKSREGRMEILIIRREEKDSILSEWEKLRDELTSNYNVDMRDIKVEENEELKIMSLRFTIIDNKTGILVVYDHRAQTQGKQESEIRQEAYKIDHPDLAKLFAEFARSFADKINARAKSSSPAF